MLSKQDEETIKLADFCPNKHCVPYFSKSSKLSFNQVGDGQFTGGYFEWQVHCTCGVNGPAAKSKELSVEVWNDMPRDLDTQIKKTNACSAMQKRMTDKRFAKEYEI